MISVVTYGRNDNYSFNLYKRTALSFNCLAEILTDEDEIIFVDYNTPGHLPTLPEFIWDTLTEKALNLIKVIRISGELHERIKGDSPLPILENVSRNAALIRSNPKNRWVLSTNPDVILVLSARWPNLAELLRDLPDSFYEMPRFDIPESVWSSLYRGDPAANMGVLRDWLVANGAAVAETIADHHFQKYYLFDAPGDFQLAPREYFFRLRGFDETMTKYLHSDSNLAKRLWLLNRQRVDHLLDHLWVLHQDHYLSGEWTRTFTTIEHNDCYQKVLRQDSVEANDENWGLQRSSLPCFPLREKVRCQRVYLPQLASGLNGDLPLSREIDWRLQPFYRLCHYQPEVLSLYLREVFQVVAPESKIGYVGENQRTLECVRQVWRDISPGGSPVQNLLDLPDPGEYASPDILLVDCFYERSEYWENRIRLLTEQLARQVDKGRISKQDAEAELSGFADNADWENQRERLESLWVKCLPSLTAREGGYVILLGCNLYVPSYEKFQELFARLCTHLVQKASWLQALHAFYQKVKFRAQGAAEHSPMLKVVWALRVWKRRAFRKFMGTESIMGWIYHRHVTRRMRRLIPLMNLRPRYIHHRLVVLQVEM